MGRFCGILGPMYGRFGLKCLFFWPCGVPKEAQDGMFKGAIFKIMECLQTILFTTLEACQRSHGQVFGRVRWGSFGGFLEELRRSSVLNANVGAVSSCTCVATGVPWALLGSTWTRSKGQRMAQVFAFLRVFIVPGVFLKAFWKALGQQSEQRGHRSCNICSHEFRLRECGR